MRRSNAIEDSEKQVRETYFSPSKKRFSLSIRSLVVKKRTCLMCGKKFLSKGPHNRRCKKCNQKIAQAGENAFYLPTVYSTNYKFDESLSGLD